MRLPSAWPIHAAYLALIALALRGVGVCCDDFVEIVGRTAASPVEDWQATPLLILTHGLAYKCIGYAHLWLYDVLKAAWVAAAYLAAFLFGRLYFPVERAALFAALFVLYPSHDSTVFWFSNTYLTATAALYLLAFWLAARGRLFPAAAAALAASFISYGSPPFALGFAFVFVLQRRLREAAALLAPNLLYAAYYVYVTRVLGVGSRRLPEQWNLLAMAKQFALQVLGGAEAVLGPSLALKVWASIASLTVLSMLAALAIVAVLASAGRAAPASGRVPAAVWLGAVAIALLGFAMFALTGAYPQAAFGMVNRVTIYASFPVALAIAAVPLPRPAYAAIAAVLVLATLGIGDHWRAWSRVQDETIAAIRGNAALRQVPAGSIVFVAGRAYSRLGPFAHIAFLANRWTTEPVFALALGGHAQFTTVPIGPWLRPTASGADDLRHGDSLRIGEWFTLYDAEHDQLRTARREELAALIERERLPRHWIQLIDAPEVRAWLLRWMPGLASVLS